MSTIDTVDSYYQAILRVTPPTALATTIAAEIELGRSHPACLRRSADPAVVQQHHPGAGDV